MFSWIEKIIEYTYDDNSDIKELKDKATNYLSDKINHIVQMMSVTDLIEINFNSSNNISPKKIFSVKISAFKKFLRL